MSRKPSGFLPDSQDDPKRDLELAVRIAPTGAELPFVPFSDTLRDVLRKKYIKRVAIWLLGRDDNSILAQHANSAWESALSIIFLQNASDIFAQCNEEHDLQATIRFRSTVVARWLLSKKLSIADGQYVSWENVTWDTSVVIRGLLVTLKKYESSFSDSEKRDIIDAIVKGTKWLYFRFSNWETQVKYPFGPADVAQIVITILHLSNEYPELYQRICCEYFGEKAQGDLCAEIIKYLLHLKTEQTLTIQTAAGSEEVVSYWWDDYFSTAEVVEALALFYRHCETSPERMELHRTTLVSLKEALIRACTYFEQDQTEGMWGSHIDTIKVIYSYVLIRRMIPQRVGGAKDPLIVPEIHTTFKALRWMCDEKQIFTDGSFLHTMFLTIFYAMALIEVYRSWEPAKDKIEKIYDDVVWFSPVRTTPERSKRLAAELRNSQLQDQLARERQEKDNYWKTMRDARRTQAKIVVTASVVLTVAPLFFLIGNLSGILSTTFRVVRPSDLLQYIAVAIPVLFAALAVIWRYDRFFSMEQESLSEPR